mgnify:CR=1 FL=1
MAPSIDSGAIASRVMLRDCLNRLRNIRVKCGKQDEDGPLLESTGDPFRDRIINFQRLVKQVTTTISERNDSTQKKVGSAYDMAEDSHQVNTCFKDLRESLREIDAMIKESAAKYAKHAKKGREDKMAHYEKEEKDRRAGYDACKATLDKLTELNQQRNLTKKEIEKSKAMRDAEGKLQERVALRQSMKHRIKQKPTDGGEDPDAGSAKLDEDPETAEATKQLALKQQRQDAMLDDIGKSMDRILSVATQIGSELDTQDKMLQDAEDKADKATSDLKLLNKGLTKLMKDQKPMNVIINVACGAVLLGLVGYFLYDFGAV